MFPDYELTSPDRVGFQSCSRMFDTPSYIPPIASRCAFRKPLPSVGSGGAVEAPPPESWAVVEGVRVTSTRRSPWIWWFFRGQGASQVPTVKKQKAEKVFGQDFPLSPEVGKPLWGWPKKAGTNHCNSCCCGTVCAWFPSGGTDKKPPRARGYAEDDIVGGMCGVGGEAGPLELKAGSNGAVR